MATSPPAKQPHLCAFPQLLDQVVVVDDLAPNSKSLLDACALLRTELDDQTRKRKDGAADVVPVPMLGVDMEWTTTTTMVEVTNELDPDQPPKMKKVQNATKVALLQLCSGNVCVLFRLCCHKPLWDAATPAEACKHFPAPVLELLSDKTTEKEGGLAVVKVGVGIQGDQAKLEKDYGISMGPVMEAMCAAYHLLPIEKIPTEGKSLKDLSRIVCGVTLTKDLSVTLSNWADDKTALNKVQIEYASDDARASYLICESILKTAYAEAVSTKDEGGVEQLVSSSSFYTAVTRLFGVPPVDPKKKKKMSTEEKQQQRKAKAKAIVPTKLPDADSFTGRTKQYYDNIRILDPTGNLLCTADTRKAGWYVNKKGLAFVTKLKDGTVMELPPEAERLVPQEVASDTIAAGDDETVVVSHTNTKTNETTECVLCPPAKSVDPETMAEIQLRFFPSNERSVNDEYYLSEKKNQCVVCGNEDKLVRHFIVPIAYRKHLPMDRVYHNSYDIMLICTKCFPRVAVMVDKEREQLATEFKFPLTAAEQQHCPDAPLGLVIEERMSAEGKSELICSGNPGFTDPAAAEVAGGDRTTQPAGSVVYRGQEHVPMSLVAEHRARLGAIIRYCGVLKEGLDAKAELTKTAEEDGSEGGGGGDDQGVEALGFSRKRANGRRGARRGQTGKKKHQKALLTEAGDEDVEEAEDVSPENPSSSRGKKKHNKLPEERIKVMVEFLVKYAGNYRYGVSEEEEIFRVQKSSEEINLTETQIQEKSLHERYTTEAKKSGGWQDGVLKTVSGEVLQLSSISQSAAAEHGEANPGYGVSKSPSSGEEKRFQTGSGTVEFDPKEPLNYDFLSTVCDVRVADCALKATAILDPAGASGAETSETTTTPGDSKPSAEHHSINFLLRQTHYSYVIQHILERGRIKDAVLRLQKEKALVSSPTSVEEETRADSVKQAWKHSTKSGDQVALEQPCLVAEVTEFVIRWRQLFMNKMKPQFLPTAWDPLDGRSVVSFMTAQQDPLDPCSTAADVAAGSKALVL